MKRKKKRANYVQYSRMLVPKNACMPNSRRAVTLFYLFLFIVLFAFDFLGRSKYLFFVHLNIFNI